jgi:hypothetical protein
MGDAAGRVVYSGRTYLGDAGAGRECGGLPTLALCRASRVPGEILAGAAPNAALEGTLLRPHSQPEGTRG